MAVEITGNTSLKWDAGIDLTKFRKDAKEIEAILSKLGGVSIDFDLEKLPSEFKEIAKEASKSSDEVVKSLKKQSVQFSDSAKEIEEYKKAMNAGSGATVATSGKDALLKELKNDYKAISDEQAKLEKSYNSGKISLDQYSKSTEQLSKKQADLKDDITRIAKSQGINTDEIQKSIKPTREQIGLLQRLKNELKGLKENQLGQTNIQGLEDSNRKIQEYEAEIKRLSNVGKVGFDQLGNAMDKPVGKIERLRYVSERYREAAERAINPAIIEKYNRKLQDTEAELSKITNIGKDGFDEFGNKLEESSSISGGLASTFQNVAAAVGIAFSVEGLISFGKELFNIGVTASGVDRAFAAIGDKNYLEKLRKETNGFIEDFDLERLAVKANNLNIPLENLGTYLSFAAQRAKDTGEEVDGLVDNIIDGLGRESKLIIDNLGISQKDLNEEIQKTGDFATAVSNIMKREMGQSGVAVDTLADKTSRLSTTFSNLFKRLGTFLTSGFSRDLADNDVIGEITAKGLKGLNDFGSKSAQVQQKIIDQQIKKVAQLSAAYQAAEKKIESLKVFGVIETNDQKALNSKKRTGEQLVAAQNILKALKEQNIEYLKQERIAKGIVSINDLEAKKQSAEDKLKGSTSASEQSLLRKEIADYQKKIDEINGVADKKEDKAADRERKRRQRIYDQSVKDRQALMDRISDIDKEYFRKSQTQDEAEIQAVRDKFADLALEIKRFNEDPKNKGRAIDVTQLDPIREKAISDLTAKQNVEKEKISIESQKQLFTQYEDFKLEYGKQKADERFKSELGGYADYVTFLQSKLKGLEGKSDAGSNALKDFYNSELPKAQKEANEKSFNENLKNLKRIQDAIKTAASEEYRINEQYDKDLATLRLNYTGEELALKEALLERHRRMELEGVKEIAFEETKIAQDMAKNLFYMTASQLKEQLRILKSDLKANDLLPDGDPKKLTPEQRKALQGQISGVKQTVFEGGETASISKEIAKYASVASDSFYAWADALAGVNDNLSYTLGQIGELTGIAGNLAADIASGDPVKQITGVIKAGAALFSMNKKVKEMNAAARAEVQAFYDAAVAGEVEYQAILRDRARQQAEAGSNRVKGMKEEYNLLLKQQKELDRQALEQLKRLQGGNFVESVGYEHGTWLRKASTWNNYASLAGKAFEEIEQLNAQGKLSGWEKEVFDSLVKIKEEGGNVERAMRDLEETINEVFTGTTSDALADSLAQMFRDGKTSAQDLADFFQDAMEDAAFSIFRNNILADMMDDFYGKFAEKATSGDNLTEKEISELATLYEGMTEEAKRRWEELQKVTGVDFAIGGDNSNSLAGSIKKELTEETGTVIAGAFNAMRISLFSIQESSTKNLEQVIKIERNTFRTANNTKGIVPALNRIESKLDKNNNALSANGKIG